MNRNGDRPYSGNTLRNLLTDLAVRLDVRDSTGALVDFNRTHRFRHTVATGLPNTGVPFRHANAAATERGQYADRNQVTVREDRGHVPLLRPQPAGRVVAGRGRPVRLDDPVGVVHDAGRLQSCPVSTQSALHHPPPARP